MSGTTRKPSPRNTRPRHWGVVLVCLALFASCAQTTLHKADGPQRTGTFQAGLIDELEDFFPDSIVATTAVERMELDTARGVPVAVHILLNSASTEQALRFSIERNGRPVRGARWFRLVDVPVEINTGTKSRTELHNGEKNPDVIRRAPFRVYEALEPIESPIRPQTATLALRVEFPIDAKESVGDREYTIHLASDQGQRSLSLDLRVHTAVVPPPGRETLSFTNWFSHANIAKYHDLEPWSEAHWQMIERYARLMAYARQNTFWFTWGDFIQRQPDGRMVLKRERFRRYVNLFLDLGFYYIEGSPIAGRPNGDWSTATLNLNLTGAAATTPEGNRALAEIAGLIMEEIRANGWEGRWLQHIADEPTENNADDYRILAGMLRKYMPGIPIVEATMNLKVAGAVDIWCLQVQEYQKHRETFDAFREQGDRIWVYTCLVPGGPWINRLLDQERMRPMLVGWAAALFDLDGFLHWGLNHFQADPFEKSVVPHPQAPEPKNSLPAGDTHVVYPGADGPWSSLRFEAHRVGLEDYELLRELDTQNPALAERIVRQVIRGFDDYTKDPTVYRAAKRDLLEAF